LDIGLAIASRILRAERVRFSESELKKVNDFIDGPAPEGSEAVDA
jgi:hypothetical protein